MNRDQIEQMAAQWLLRREEPHWSPDDAAQLQLWLDESVAHQAAFWRLEAGWARVDVIAEEAGNVRTHDPRSWMSRKAAIASTVAAVTAIAASILLAFAIVPGWRQHPAVPVAPTDQVATALGGRTHLALSDGSQIELNTETAMRTAITDRHREVWLDHGEAYFEVRHSETLPFIVHAGPRTVTVLGTKFSVRRDGDRVTVQVVEGRVRVDETAQPKAQDASTTVTTGDIAIGNGPSTLVTRHAGQRIENALAWRDGRIVFNNTSLEQAASEFNRYTDRKLIIADPTTAQIRIGGTFQASNVDAFVRLLHDAYGLSVDEDEQAIRIAE